MDILLWFFYFATTLGGNCFAKLSSNRLGEDGAYPVFFTVNGIIACLFFGITGGFRLQCDGVTALFALLYAGVVLLSLYSNMAALRSASIACVSIISSTGTLLLSSLLGAILFSEAFTWQVALRIVLMLTASVFLFWEQRDGRRIQWKALLPMVGLVIGGAGNYLVLKLYTQVPHAASEDSFFFFTNLILVIGAVGWLLITQQRFQFPLKRSLPFVANTLCCNGTSLVSIFLIARTEAVFYNPVSSAMCTLCVMLASVIFRERLGLRSCIAAGLAILTVVI